MKIHRFENFIVVIVEMEGKFFRVVAFLRNNCLAMDE
jgi:hypothetical protein